jgi:hypothetical protein
LRLIRALHKPPTPAASLKRNSNIRTTPERDSGKASFPNAVDSPMKMPLTTQ